jgi:hypothetical protein
MVYNQCIISLSTPYGYSDSPVREYYGDGGDRVNEKRDEDMAVRKEDLHQKTVQASDDAVMKSVDKMKQKYQKVFEKLAKN